MKHNFVAVNAVGVEHGEKFGEIIVAAAWNPRHQASFVGVVEADAIDLRDNKVSAGKEHPVDLDRLDWRHRQNDVDKDGCLAMWDKSVAREFARPTWDLLSNNVWRDKRGRDHHEQMNGRYALTVNLEFLRSDGGFSRQPVTVVHFPPSRYDILRRRAADNAKHYGLFLGDLNYTERVLRRIYENRKIRGTEVIHAVAKQYVNIGKSTKIEVGDSDHPGIKFPVNF